MDPVNEQNTDMNIELFKMTLKEYLKLDEEIKTICKCLKERREKIEALNSTLLAFLNKNEINQVQLEGAYQGQELVPAKTQKTKSPGANSILDIVKLKLADKPELLNEITQEIEGLRETVEVEKIKISKVRAAKVAVKKPKKATLAEESAMSTALLLGTSNQ
jgi:hypothetical protein